MPFVSNRQRSAMNAKAARGEIPQSTVDEFNSASRGLKLPERVRSGGKGLLNRHFGKKKEK